MIIDYEGRTYEFDSDDLTVKQALKIEKHIGGPMIDWEKGLATGSAAAYQALGWLIFHGGDSTPITDVDFKFGKLAKAFEAAAALEAEAAETAGEPPDPTATNGSAPTPRVSSLTA